MKFELTILGSNSATPAFGRNQTAQILNSNEIFYLIDCGEGTQLQLQRFGLKSSRIKYVFISHLHGDHYLGLVGLISSMHLNGRKEALHVFGPEPLLEIIQIQLRFSETILSYPLHFEATDPLQESLILENDDLYVYSFPLQHRIPCTGFRFVEKKRLPHILRERVEKLGIPKVFYSKIKRGMAYTDQNGLTYPASELTVPAPMPKSYAFCSDTVCSWSYLESIRGVNLLYHEATFLQEMQARALETYHTTAFQAGEVALKANVQSLLIGHFSSRYRDLDPLLAESKSVFANVKLAIEGQTYEIM
ncbi:ribonuclease Z [Olivibacter sitiensis]|uniref:ribonuclease Z n=1 Tax=Olivibacter sitiensis TaxID=376470 RepID=UPI00041FB22B|nr:ribonuclease Z [Olivibacter sitiensis]